MCCLCFTFCGPCSFSGVLAKSLQEDCAVVNHCLIGSCLCYCIGLPSARSNTRRAKGLGVKECPDMCGDVLCCVCCGACTLCQILSEYKREDWDWISKMKG